MIALLFTIPVVAEPIRRQTLFAGRLETVTECRASNLAGAHQQALSMALGVLGIPKTGQVQSWELVDPTDGKHRLKLRVLSETTGWVSKQRFALLLESARELRWASR